MNILITGKTGVGKSAILKNLNFNNKINMDDYVKNFLYTSEHPIFQELIDVIGDHVVVDNKINIELLTQELKSDSYLIHKIVQVITPVLKSYFASFEKSEVHLFEMAGYLNYETEFKDCFDKVVLINKEVPDTKDKFKSVNGDLSLIESDDIEFDLLIENNSTIDEACKKIEIFIRENS